MGTGMEGRKKESFMSHLQGITSLLLFFFSLPTTCISSQIYTHSVSSLMACSIAASIPFHHPSPRILTAHPSCPFSFPSSLARSFPLLLVLDTVNKHIQINQSIMVAPTVKLSSNHEVSFILLSFSQLSPDFLSVYKRNNQLM